MKKQLAAIVLVLTLVASLVPATLAATSNNDAQAAADALNKLGLFQGTDQGYELNRAPNRQEAITMLVRLLGKENEAKDNTWSHPFTDVDAWAQPYVGYAYANKITSGTGASTFGSKDTVSASQYLTFVLRALGYTSGVDFQWDKAWELSDKIGLTNGQYKAGSAFVRGDVAVVSYSALSVENTAGVKLVDVLIESGAVDSSVATVTEPIPDNEPDKQITVKIGSYELEGVLHEGKEYVNIGQIRDMLTSIDESYVITLNGNTEILTFAILIDDEYTTLKAFKSTDDCFYIDDKGYRNIEASLFINEIFPLFNINP